MSPEVRKHDVWKGSFRIWKTEATRTECRDVKLQMPLYQKWISFHSSSLLVISSIRQIWSYFFNFFFGFICVSYSFTYWSQWFLMKDLGPSGSSQDPFKGSQSQKYFHNNTKTSSTSFSSHFLMSIQWSFQKLQSAKATPSSFWQVMKCVLVNEIYFP